ncbi:MAG: archaeal heat shock protein Hsp20, partial [Candidatus Ranarchaeia archaeon]
MNERDDEPDKEDDGPPWFSDYGEIDMERIQDMINNLLKNFESYAGFNFKDLDKMMRENMGHFGPVLFGFSATPGPDGKIRFRPFGNIHPNRQGKPTLKMEREPLVDVIEEDGSVTIIVELPGITRDDIQLTATERKVKIKVDTPERKYFKLIDLPAEIVTTSAKARFKNGVLEVRF